MSKDQKWKKSIEKQLEGLHLSLTKEIQESNKKIGLVLHHLREKQLLLENKVEVVTKSLVEKIIPPPITPPEPGAYIGGIEVKVGQWWETRDGLCRYKITSTFVEGDEPGAFYICAGIEEQEADYVNFWHPNGHYGEIDETKNADLVKLVEDV